MQETTNVGRFTGISYRGKAPLNGMPAGPKELQLTVGGIFDSSASENIGYEAYFGRVVSADTAEPHNFIIGAGGAVLQGIVLFDPAITKNQPAASDHYIADTPMTVLKKGLAAFSSWTKTAAGAIDPVLGCEVIYNNTTGAIEFLTSGAAPTGWTIMPAAIFDIDENAVTGKVVVIDFDFITGDVDVAALSSSVSALSTKIDAAAELAGKYFRKTVTITAAAAASAVHILTAAEVGAGLKAFITDFDLSVGGTVAWTDSTGTGLTLQDTADTPIVAASFAKAQLTSQAQLGKHSTGVTLGTPIRTGVGLTAAKGVDIVADSNFDAGSDITITVTGFIAAA
jgi:hypothetical protein